MVVATIITYDGGDSNVGTRHEDSPLLFLKHVFVCDCAKTLVIFYYDLAFSSFAKQYLA